MSRTVHHLPYYRAFGRYPGPTRTTATITTLRYSAADLALADTLGERPRPAQRDHHVHLRPGSRIGERPGAIGLLTRRDEARARRARRDGLRAAVGLLRAGGAGDEIDVLPVRHRGNAIWDVC